mgnify:CR=1 FL=1
MDRYKETFETWNKIASIYQDKFMNMDLYNETYDVKKNNPKASFAIMDCRQIDQLKTTYNGIIGGFCLPYLSDLDIVKLVADCSNLLSENGLIYLSFVEGDPKKSDYQVNNNGDRVYFYFYQLDTIKKLLTDNNFVAIKVFYVEYKKSETGKDIHTILIAKKASTN